MPRPNASALAKLTPTSSAPTSPGAFVTATASTSPSSTFASASAWRTTGTIAVRWCRDAISGTTPPKMRWTSCDRMTSDSSVASSPRPESTAADVSSHDVSMPRMRVTSSARRGVGAEQLADQRAIGLGAPVGGADDLLPDRPVAGDDEGLRVAGDLVVARRDRRRIVQDLEGEAEVLHELADVVLGAGV